MTFDPKPLHTGARHIYGAYRMPMRVIRVADIATTKDNPGMLPVSPATIWRWVREGKFPKPFKLGDSVTCWNASEIEAFIAQRAAVAA